MSYCSFTSEKKKKKREETAFLDFTDPQQDPLHAVTFAFL